MYELLEKKPVEKVTVGERFQRPAHPHVARGILLKRVPGGAGPDHPAIDSPRRAGGDHIYSLRFLDSGHGPLYISPILLEFLPCPLFPGISSREPADPCIRLQPGGRPPVVPEVPVGETQVLRAQSRGHESRSDAGIVVRFFTPFLCNPEGPLPEGSDEFLDERSIMRENGVLPCCPECLPVGIPLPLL